MHSLARALTDWTRLPGNWDILHCREAFLSNNEYGIPTIARDEGIPARLIQWGSLPKLRAVEEGSNACVHFFLDDYRFESLWRNPARNLDALKSIGLVLSPDFSLFRDMPVAMQIWNVYRNRWLGRYWQERGIQVIPTISWSEPYDFCYMGVERGSIVAISSIGVIKDRQARRLFRTGFEAMLNILSPSTILCYGSLAPLGIETDVPVVTFPTRWEERQCTKYSDMEAKYAPSLWEVPA